jgi:hypothetical protein
VATINNFPSPQENKLSQDAVVYFCESHNESPQERDNIQATSDLLHRYAIELMQYEKYELRTGYLSRWNYMPKDFEEMSSEEIEEATKKDMKRKMSGYKDANRNYQNHLLLKIGKIVLVRKKIPIIINLNN